MRISVFGLGYVGAVSVACLADLGHQVLGVDVNAEKVHAIADGRSPIIEPQLDELLRQGVAADLISATTEAESAVSATDVAVVCVSTPSNVTGGIDGRYLEQVCRQIGEALAGLDTEHFTVIVRSTVLPQVHREVMNILTESSGRGIGTGLGYVCHPEFLREGTGVEDFYAPPKIVFGATDASSERVCRNLYPGIEAETFFVDLEVASMVKYADNAFHATKVTFANEIGMICKALGVDSRAVMEIFRRDRKLNVSEKYLRPGNPFGGSCLPKDLRGLLDTSRVTATPLLLHAAALESNRIQVERLVERITDGNGRNPVGLVGLSFKEGTDDVRESPMVYVVEQLVGKGVPVTIYDAHLAIRDLVGRNRSFALETIPHLAELLTQSLEHLISQAETLVVHHRLSPEIWRSLQIPSGTRVIDLVGIEELSDHPLYEGLYW